MVSGHLQVKKGFYYVVCGNCYNYEYDGYVFVGGTHLNKTKYTNYDDLPLMLSVPDVASVLGISRAGAYELVRSDGFPSLRIGSRIVVPKEKFIGWINANTNA